MSTRRLLSPAAVARILGVHRRTIRRWIEAEIFPAARINGRWYTTAAELAAWEAERFARSKVRATVHGGTRRRSGAG